MFAAVFLTSTLPTDRRWRELSLWLLLAVVLTPVFWLTDLDIRAAGYFFDAARPESPWWMEDALWVRICYYAPPVLVTILLLTAIVAYVWGTKQANAGQKRRIGVFLLVSLLLGPGVLVNAVFKNHWGRPRPKHVVQFNGPETFRPPLLKGEAGKAKSFPAGHSSVAFAYIAFYFLLRRTRPKLAWGAFAFSATLGAVMGVARMAAGGHFLSDVIWSALITWWAVWFAYYFLLRMETEPAKETDGALPGNDAVIRSDKAKSWLAWAKNSALILAVVALVIGVLIATPLHKQFKFSWANPELAPSAVVIVSAGADVKIRVNNDSNGPALSIAQTIQGFGLPGGRLKVSTDPEGTSVPWTYRGNARGTFTELENVIEIIVSSPKIATLNVQVGAEGGVKVDDPSGRLKVVSDAIIEVIKRDPVGLPAKVSAVLP